MRPFPSAGIAGRWYSSSRPAQLTAYVYVSAGCTESTTDLIFSGHSLVCENGRLLAENTHTIDSDYLLYSDIDLGKLRTDRRKIKTFAQSTALCGTPCRRVAIPCPAAENDLAFYPVEKLPFVPNVRRDRAERCMGIFEMQVLGLKKRMDITRSRPIIGVSGRPGFHPGAAGVHRGRAAAPGGQRPMWWA